MAEEAAATEATPAASTEAVTNDSSLFSPNPDAGVADVESTEVTEATEEASEGTVEETPTERGEDFDFKMEFEDLEKRHKKLVDIHKGRSKEMPDELFDEVLKEKGIEVKQAPETYEQDSIAEAMREVGMQVMDYEDPAGKELWDDFYEKGKANKWSQTDMVEMAKLAGPLITESLARFGAPDDKEAELAKAVEYFGGGEKGGKRGEQLINWATSNDGLPADVLNRPLTHSAEGWKVLDQLQKLSVGNSKGPIVSNNTRPDPASQMDMNNKIKDMQTSDAYRDPLHRDHENIHKELDRLMTLKHKRR